MSIGTFGTGLSTQYRFGLALSTKPKGVIMDIDRILKQTVDKDNVRAKVTAYNRATGPSMSLNENLIPEQLFDDPKTAEKEVEGVSAVKAIQIAQQQGQTVYTITRENYAQVLPKLSLSANVMSDINNAINAGRTVTVHEKSIQYKGWHGSGYIITDPNTGAGAYLIDGEANGAFLIFLGISVLALSIALIATGGATAIGVAAVISGLLIVAAGVAVLSGNELWCRTLLTATTVGFMSAVVITLALGIVSAAGFLTLPIGLINTIRGLGGTTTAISVGISSNKFSFYGICRV